MQESRLLWGEDYPSCAVLRDLPLVEQQPPIPTRPSACEAVLKRKLRPTEPSRKCRVRWWSRHFESWTSSREAELLGRGA